MIFVQLLTFLTGTFFSGHQVVDIFFIHLPHSWYLVFIAVSAFEAHLEFIASSC